MRENDLFWGLGREEEVGINYLTIYTTKRSQVFEKRPDLIPGILSIMYSAIYKVTALITMY